MADFRLVGDDGLCRIRRLCGHFPAHGPVRHLRPQCGDSVGGGIIRDILIGNIPPAAFKNSIYLWIILGSMAVITIIVRYFNIRMWRRVVGKLSIWYLVCDAIGLGSFTVTGTSWAVSTIPTTGSWISPSAS